MSIKPLPISVPAGIAQPQPVVGADAMLAQVKSGLKGVGDRIKGLDLVTVPASFIGPTPAYVFKPEAGSFDLDVFQWNEPVLRPVKKVNYVVRSGTTYQLPVIVGGNGVFLAHRFRINLWQRLYVNSTSVKGAAQAVISPIVNSFLNNTTTGQYRVNWTTKFSCYPIQPAAASFAMSDTASQSLLTQQSPMMNYRWNIQDPVTGYNYADNLMPASAILNRDYVQMTDNTLTEMGSGSATPGNILRTAPALLFDGDWHEFDAPWRFDQAYQLNVMFRPITDIVQFDSTVDIGPSAVDSYMRLLPYDDRVNGIRDQSVYVQVEFQGERIGGTP